MSAAAYISSVRLSDDHDLDPSAFPGKLPSLRNLDIKINAPVTFFVGENGSGKSTLIEAMAVMLGLPISGGGTSDTGTTHAISERSLLAPALEIEINRRPRDRYFFRAETQSHFASLLEQRDDDPEFEDDPFKHYGGRSLHTMSHGEAFLSVMTNRFERGLFLMDEPESALSPQRQLALLALMHRMVDSGETQFFIATHSPILLTFPGATILSFDHGPLKRVSLDETSHFQITRDLLNNPSVYWKHLVAADASD